MQDKVVIALSGGMDSSTLLGVLLHEKKQVYCCLFKYPSKHNTYEISSACDVIDHYRKLGYPVQGEIFDLSSVFTKFNSNLLQSGGAIPEGHYEQENMKLTVVPGRNSIFATVMAGYAESVGASEIFLGVHSGDHAIYPDCRPEFIESMYKTINISSAGKVAVVAPFLDRTKSDILRVGFELEVPYELTRTCYKDQVLSCGKCGSCVERLEAFSIIGKKDSIPYER